MSRSSPNSIVIPIVAYMAGNPEEGLTAADMVLKFGFKQRTALRASQALGRGLAAEDQGQELRANLLRRAANARADRGVGRVKYIRLGPKEFRCRPAKGWQQLLNDCGMQKRCARRLAANTVGAPEDDLSKDAKPNPYVSGLMTCPHHKVVE